MCFQQLQVDGGSSVTQQATAPSDVIHLTEEHQVFEIHCVASTTCLGLYFNSDSEYYEPTVLYSLNVMLLYSIWWRNTCYHVVRLTIVLFHS